MSNNKIPNQDFVICVRESDLLNKRHVLIHPVLFVRNGNPDNPVSPESVIDGFKMLGSFQNRNLIAISKSQVSKKNWNLLKEGLKDSEICSTGIKVKTEVLCTQSGKISSFISSKEQERIEQQFLHNESA